MTKSTWLRAVTQVDAEIVELQRRLILLKQQRNTLVPLGQLRNELLARIFFPDQNTIEDENESDLGYEARHTSAIRTWPKHMLLCRRFRDLALTHRNLWSYIDLGHRNSCWSQICLQRSANCLLSVNAPIHRGNMRLMSLKLEALLPQARYARLHFMTTSSQQWDVTQEEDTKFCKILERINGQLSNLRSLNIINDTLLWENTCSVEQSDSGNVNGFRYYPSLDRLIMNWVDADYLCKRPYDPLYHTQRLSYLRLFNLWSETLEERLPEFQGSVADALARRPLIDLPNLRTLQLEGTMSAPIQVLLLLPDPTLDFALSVYTSVDYDKDMPSDNPQSGELDKFVNTLHYIQARLARFFLRATESGSTHSVFVKEQLSPSVSNICISPDVFTRDQMTLKGEMLGMYNSDLHDYLGQFPTVSLAVRATGLVKFSPFLQKMYQSNQRITLSIYNMRLKPAQCASSLGEDDPQLILERILAERARMGMSLQTLIFLYEDNALELYDQAADDVSDLLESETEEIFDGLAEMWMDQGWVGEVDFQWEK